MKIVFSRKGFDSASGGAPSPIINGHPISLPIPARDRSDTTYGDLGLGTIVEGVTRGKFNSSSLCHNDPMFELGRCAFGQTGTAQTHLANQDVSIGDIFLFFGLFSQADGSDRHHRIFGYLEVEEIVKPGSTPKPSDQPSGFSLRHPHTIGEWNDNNSIYIGPGTTIKSAPSSLRLSLPAGPVSMWAVPSWLRDVGLSYHGNPSRWMADGTLRAVSRGQEFVTDVSDSHEAATWLQDILDLVTNSPSD